MKIGNSNKINLHSKGLLLGFLLTIVSINYSYSDSYRTKGGGAISWTNIAAWERFNGLTWVNATQLPSSSDDVFIKNYIMLSAGNSVNCSTLTVQSIPLTSNGILELNGDLTIGSNLTQTDGAIFIYSGANLNVSGNVNQTQGSLTQSSGATLSINGSANFVDLTLAGALTVGSSITLGGSININSTGSLSVSGNFTQTAGSITADTGSTLSITGTATFSNASLGGATSVTSNISIVSGPVTTSYNGSVGTLTSTSGNITIDSNGTLTISNGGSVTLTNGIVNVGMATKGSLQVNNGTTLTCKGLNVGNASNTSTLLSGTIDLGAGTWTNNGPVAPVDGLVYNFTNLTVGAGQNINLQGGTLNGPSTASDGSNSNNSCSIDLSQGTISCTNGGTIDNPVYPVIKIKGSLTIGSANFSPGQSTIYTYGTSTITAANAIILNNINVTTGSTLNLDADLSTSTVKVNGGITNAGTLNIYKNYQFITFNNSGTVNNYGSIIIDNDVYQTNPSFTISSGSFTSQPSSSVTFSSVNLATTISGSNIAFNDFTHSGAGLISSSADFSVAGNYANTGGAQDTFTGTVTFTGTSKTLDGGSAGTTFKNLTISGSYGAANKVNLTGVLDIGTTGIFDADGSGSAVFTIKSTSLTSTGSIATLSTPANLSGNMTIERFYTNDASRRWQYMAFPFSSTITVQDLETAGFTVNGHFSGSSTVNESMFIYKAGAGFDQWIGIGWSGLAKSLYHLDNNVGYAALGYPYNAKGTIALTGAPSKGNISIPVDATGTTKYNLIPNPYPSPLSFTALRAGNTGLIGTTVEVETNLIAGAVGQSTTTSTATYTIAGGTCVNCAALGGSTWQGTIASGQSFWVTATGTGNLSVTESMKALSTDTYSYVGKTIQGAPKDYIRMTITSGDMKDESIVFFRKDATETFDFVVDAKKRLNGVPVKDTDYSTYVNMGTLKSDTPDPLVFNFSPFVDCQTGVKTIKLFTQVSVAGTHSLKFTDMETFTLGYGFTLFDRFLNKKVEVKNGTEYSFSTTDLSASSASDRFELLVAPPEIQTPAIVVKGTKLSTVAAPVIQWFKDGKLIQNATSPEINITESGSYTVNAGYTSACTKASIPVVMTITGDIKDASELIAYPNPSEGVFTVLIPTLTSLDQLKVSDSKGVTVNASITKSESNVTIDLSNYSSGLYILKIKEGNSNHIIKLIKK